MTWWEILVRAYRVLYNRFFWRIQPEDDLDVENIEPVRPEIAKALAAPVGSYVPLTSSANLNKVMRRVQGELRNPWKPSLIDTFNPYQSQQNAYQQNVNAGYGSQTQEQLNAMYGGIAGYRNAMQNQQGYSNTPMGLEGLLGLGSQIGGKH